MVASSKGSCWAKLRNFFRKSRGKDELTSNSRSLGTAPTNPDSGQVEERLGSRARPENSVLTIKDSTQLLDDGNRRYRGLGHIEGIIIHRISPALGLNALELTKSFMQTNKYEAGYYTGGRMPYTFVCTLDGIVEQAKSLLIVTPHAKKYNRTHLGIAVIGDFRLHHPLKLQWKSTLLLCKALFDTLGWPLPVYGHTELAGASGDQQKECPGQFWPMDQFRDELSQLVHNQSSIGGGRRDIRA